MGEVDKPIKQKLIQFWTQQDENLEKSEPVFTPTYHLN